MDEESQMLQFSQVEWRSEFGEICFQMAIQGASTLQI